jgi:DNA repair exonuclease SbcCD ATPase subunit
MRKLWPVLILAVAAGAGCNRQPAPDPKLVARLNQLENENAQLRTRLAQAEAQRAQSPAEPSPSAPADKERSKSLHPSRAIVPAYEAMQIEVHSLRAEAAESREAINRLETGRTELQGQLDALTAENKRLSTIDEDIKGKLAEAERRRDQLQAQLTTQREQAVQLESANSRLRQLLAAAQKASTPIAELQDLSRRRQQYIESILRRFRELTEQYRTLGASIDRRRDTDPAAATSGAETSRIQSTLVAVDEDIKQLNSLNSRAQLVEKQGTPTPASKTP